MAVPPRTLTPFTPGSMWLPVSSGVVRQPTFLEGQGIREDDDPDAHYEQGVTATNGWVRGPMDTACWSSSCYNRDLIHMPMFDVDRPYNQGIPEDVDEMLYYIFRADRHWIQSKTNWHVYMDVGPTKMGYRAVSWPIYEAIMIWLGSKQMVDKGWAWYSKREGRSTLRQPWPRKNKYKGPSDTDLCCLWCGEVYPNIASLEEHEAGCG